MVFQTPVIKRTLNPVWNFVGKTFAEINADDEIIFHVWDQDPFGKDFLGKAILPVSQCAPYGFDGDLELQEAGSEAAKLRVHVDFNANGRPLDQSQLRVRILIISVLGLNATDGDVSCRGEVSGKQALKFRTPIVVNTGHPIWNHAHVFVNYPPNEPLQLSVWDEGEVGDELIGKTSLPYALFSKGGYEGEIGLRDTGVGVKAVMLVKVEIFRPGEDMPLLQKPKAVTDEIDRGPPVVAVEKPDRGFPLMQSTVRIRVTIIGARGVARLYAGDATDAKDADPYCKCEVLGKPLMRFRTNVLKKTSNPEWNYAYEFTNFSTLDNLQLSIWDKDWSGDKLLGKATLANTQFYPNGFNGKVTVQDSGATRAASLEVKVELLDKVEQSHVADRMIVKVTVYGAQNLRKGDLMGGSDAYCVCQVPGKKDMKFKTDALKDTQSPEWNMTHEFINYHAGDPLQFSVFDRDPGGDDLLGRAKVQFDQFYPNGFESKRRLMMEATGGTEASLDVRIICGAVPTSQNTFAIIVTIENARGLRKADIKGGADPYAICKLTSQVPQKFKTPVIFDTQEPEWRASHKFSNFKPGDFLDFSVWDENGAGDELLGKARLAHTIAFPTETSTIFSAELPLIETGRGGGNSFINVTIEKVDDDVPEPPLRKPPAKFDAEQAKHRRAMEQTLSKSRVDARDELDGFIDDSLPPRGLARIHIRIRDAKGLRKADWSGQAVNAFCTCAVPGKPALKFHTPVIAETRAPVWNHSHTIDIDPSYDSLRLTVTDYDKKWNEMLGRAVLPPTDFYPMGFDGDIILEVPGKKFQATLGLKIQILQQASQPSRQGRLPPSPAVAVKASPEVLAHGKQHAQRPVHLQITIIGAKGLRSADVGGESDPYCVCKIPKKKNYSFQTKVVKDTKNPQWHHTDEFIDYVPGEALQFSVYDDDVGGADLLGTATLPSEKFYPSGFDNEISLDKAGKGVLALLSLRIEVLQTEYVLCVAQDYASDLGIATSDPPGKVIVKGVDLGLWASAAGIAAGDEIVFANGEPVSTMKPSVFHDLLSISGKRPLRLIIMPKAVPEEDTENGEIHLFAGPDVRALGLAPSEPPGRIFIMAVEPGGWAAEAGVIVGDEIVEIDGSDAMDLTPSEFYAKLKKRPVSLTVAPAPIEDG